MIGRNSPRAWVVVDTPNRPRVIRVAGEESLDPFCLFLVTRGIYAFVPAVEEVPA